MKPEEQVQAQIQAVAAPKETVREQDKIHLVLAYLGILALIPLLTVKDSEYVKWHAKNGLVLGVGGGLIATIITVVIPFLGQICLGPVLFLGIFVIDIMAMVKALRGERWRIPFITDLSEKL